MPLLSWLLVFMGKRHLQPPGSSSTLGPLNSLHQWHTKTRASLRCPPWVLGVASTPQREVHNNLKLFQLQNLQAFSSFIFLVMGTITYNFKETYCYEK